METKKCQQCGKDYQKTYHSKKSWEKSKFCSIACINDNRRLSGLSKIKKFVCKNCGKEFERYASNRSYECCSIECRNKYKLKTGKTGFTKGHKDYEAKPWLGKGGEGHPQWKGGITPANKAARTTPKYQEWRIAVFKRDDWTCQNKECNERGGNLHAHHIKSFKEFPELRHEVSNGITYCKKCHKAKHKTKK